MSNPLLTKQYTAETAIAPNSFVKPGSTDDFVVAAVAATDFICGVFEGFGATGAIAGERVEIMQAGNAEVKLSATVVRGAPLTAAAAGQGVTAAPGAGVNNRIGGFARVSGVANDVIEVQLALGVMQG